MMEKLFGSKNSEKVLLYIAGRKEGYAREIADFYKTSLSPIQKQLDKFENASVFVSRSVGRTRIYSFNPRYAFNKELINLLEKAITFLPQNTQDILLKPRRRPRRKGKP